MFLSNIIIGGYDDEEKVVRVYDLVVMKYWGFIIYLNFFVSFFCGVDYIFIISYYYYIY